MPSVDKVGRYFPLTIASGVPGDGHILDWLCNQRDWFDQAEKLARSTLGNDYHFEAFDAALLAMPSLAPSSHGSTAIPLASLDEITESNSALMKQLAG